MKNSVLLKLLKEIRDSQLDIYYSTLFFEDLPIYDIINSIDEIIANKILETKSNNKRCVLIWVSVLKVKIPEEAIELISNSKHFYQIRCACDLIRNSKLFEYDINKVLGLFKLLLETLDEEKTNYIRDLLFNTKLIGRDDVIDILNTITNAKGEGQAFYVRKAISWIVENEYNGDVIKCLNILANAYGKSQASLAYNYLTKNGNDTEVEHFMSIIANTKDSKKADYILDYLDYYKTKNLPQKTVMSIANIISNSKGDYQARCALSLSKFGFIYYKKDGIEIIREIANAKEDFQADYAYKAVSSPKFMDKEIALELIQIITKIPHKANKCIEYYRDLSVYLNVLNIYDSSSLTVGEIIDYTSLNHLIENLETLDESEEISTKTLVRNRIN